MDLLNPAAGGGLSNAKLAAATAKPSEVAKGKTFYAGDKNLQTGTGPRSQSGTMSFTKSNVTQTLDLGFVPSRGYIIRDGSYSNAHYLNSSGQLFGTNDDTEQVTLFQRHIAPQIQIRRRWGCPNIQNRYCADDQRAGRRDIGILDICLAAARKAVAA